MKNQIRKYFYYSIVIALMLLGCLRNFSATKNNGVSESVSKRSLAEDYFNKAAIHLQNEEYTEAIDDCKACLDIDSSYKEAYITLGNTYEIIKNTGAALEAYNRVIDRFCDFDMAYECRGNLYVKMHNYDYAMDNFRIIRLLDPSNEKNNEKFEMCIANSGQIKYVKTNANLREQRSTSANTKRQLPIGTQIKIGLLKDDWYAVFNLDEHIISEESAIGYIWAPLLVNEGEISVEVIKSVVKSTTTMYYWADMSVKYHCNPNCRGLHDLRKYGVHESATPPSRLKPCLICCK